MNNLFNINIESHEYGFKYGCLATTLQNPVIIDGIDYNGGFDGTDYIPVQFENGYSVTYTDGVYQRIDTFINKVKINDDPTYLYKEHLLNIKILFPDFSIETYDKSPLYVFKACTYINGCEIILAQKLINRLDALADTGDLKLFNQRYFESISFNILNPLYICFDDNWKYFRDNTCVWNNLDTVGDYNDEGCILRVELIPVLENYDGTYSENEKYSGGSNSIFLGMNSNELHTELSIKDGYLVNTIFYNSFYENLETYIKDTYFTSYSDRTLGTIENTFTIINDKGDYIDLGDPQDITEDGYSYILNLPEEINWSDFRDGMFATCMTSLFDDSGNLILSMFADEFIITPESFSILLAHSKIDIQEENINSLQNMNYDIVNKIENNVIEVVRPNDDSNHIVTPIFVKSKDAQNLEVYTKVTENITLRLDAYKSSVKKFILQIEGIEFNEIARSPYGITFKVIGPTLPQVEINGTYYILNEERVLVTTGKYTYKQ